MLKILRDIEEDTRRLCSSPGSRLVYKGWTEPEYTGRHAMLSFVESRKEEGSTPKERSSKPSSKDSPPGSEEGKPWFEGERHERLRCALDGDAGTTEVVLHAVRAHEECMKMVREREDWHFLVAAVWLFK